MKTITCLCGYIGKDFKEITESMIISKDSDGNNIKMKMYQCPDCGTPRLEKE